MWYAQHKRWMHFVPTFGGWDEARARCNAEASAECFSRTFVPKTIGKRSTFA
jgi:hypothetical protein